MQLARAFSFCFGAWLGAGEVMSPGWSQAEQSE